MKFCLAIPIYKEIFDPIETLSLKQMWNILKDKPYDIYAIIPENLDLSNVFKIIPDLKSKLIPIEFDKNYFKNTYTYSQLCLSYDFYNKFNKYEYLYIYQLDVYLINDNLNYFCDLNYDYIGAPIISTDCGWPTIKKINDKNIFVPAVGNGGFSLRNVQKFMDITNPQGEFRTYYNISDDITKKIKFEDLYFCVFVAEKYNINIPKFEIAMKFAWDMSVDIIYNNWNIKELPMAIHAWDKNIRLWKNIIPELKTNTEVIDFCENKHKEFFKIYYNENNSSMR